jgi:hypothetical protein
MSNQVGRPNAAELKAQQEAREQAEVDQTTAAKAKAEEQRKLQADALQAAAIAKIKDTWYALAKDAAQRTGVRFAVASRVTSGSGAMLPVLNEIVAEAKAEGFRIELAGHLSPKPPTTGPRNPMDHSLVLGPQAGCEVYDAGVKGWYPGANKVADLTDNAGAGVLGWLVVRWP